MKPPTIQSVFACAVASALVACVSSRPPKIDLSEYVRTEHNGQELFCTQSQQHFGPLTCFTRDQAEERELARLRANPWAGQGAAVVNMSPPYGPSTASGR
jgi:hypothetical protein